MVQNTDLKHLFVADLYKKTLLDQRYGSEQPLKNDSLCNEALLSMSKLHSTVKKESKIRKQAIFGLKNALILSLWQVRPDIFKAVWPEHYSEEETVCKHCIQGMNSLDHICTSCSGTGYVKPIGRMNAILGIACQDVFEWRLPWNLALRLLGPTFLESTKDLDSQTDYQLNYSNKVTYGKPSPGTTEEEIQFILWILHRTQLDMKG
jgi:hypothetical protein